MKSQQGLLDTVDLRNCTVDQAWIVDTSTENQKRSAEVASQQFDNACSSHPRAPAMVKTPKRPSSVEQDVVSVVDVIPYVDDEQYNAVAHPNLVATSSSSNADALNDMKVRPVKRKRKWALNEATDEDWEMLGTANGRDWHGRPGFDAWNVDYFVGIHDKKSGTVKFVEVDRSFLFRPSLISDKKPRLADEKEEEKVKDRTYAERRKELLDSFGGRKSVQRAQRYERDKVTEDKLDEKTAVNVNVLAQEMKERDMKEGIDQLAHPTTESIAPPHDNNAQTPEDAYPLEGLASPTEMAALEKEAERLLSGAADSEYAVTPDYSTFVLDIISEIVAIDDSSPGEKKSRLKAAVYLNYLLCLARYPLTLDKRHQQQLGTEMGVELPILTNFLDRFSMNQGNSRLRKRLRRPDDVNQVMIYAVVMWLTIFGFSDCRRWGELATALRLEKVKPLLRHAENLGCKVKKARGQKGSQAYSLSLPVPLTFPTAKLKAGRPQGGR